MLLLRPGDLDLLFDPLRSLVAQESEEENLHVFHKTLFDFLLDPERSQQFALSKHCVMRVRRCICIITDILTSWSCEFFSPSRFVLQLMIFYRRAGLHVLRIPLLPRPAYPRRAPDPVPREP
jgi:hypothetical protein